MNQQHVDCEAIPASAIADLGGLRTTTFPYSQSSPQHRLGSQAHRASACDATLHWHDDKGWGGSGLSGLRKKSTNRGRYSEGMLRIAPDEILNVAQAFWQSLALSPSRMIDETKPRIPERSNFGPLLNV
jgi:hypothetical protein